MSGTTSWRPYLKKGFNCDDRDGENFVGIYIQQLHDGGYSMSQHKAIEKLLTMVDII